MLFGQSYAAPSAELVPAASTEFGSAPAPNSASEDPWVIAPARFGELLTGMIAQGHGLDAICLFLSLGRDALLELVVAFGLPTPHDRPHRKSGGKRAWGPADYPVLINGWLSNWHAASIADRLGRSRGGIWAKARRLGLPRRDRRALFRPLPLQPVIQPPAAVAEEVVVPEPAIVEDPVLKTEWLVANAETPIVVRWKRPGIGVDWTREMSHEAAMRKWANQRNAAIAKDFGVNIGAVTSHVYWLQIPKLPLETATDHYDPEVAKANIAKYGYEEINCVSNRRYAYWRHRRRRERCRRDVENGLYASP